MSEPAFYDALTAALFIVAGAVFVSSFFVTAPYGRYERARWAGPDLPSWAGWMLMELPQPVGMAICVAVGQHHDRTAAFVLLGLWQGHYLYRTFIYPFLPRSSSMGLTVVAMGAVLNSGFAYLNGRWLFAFGPARSDAYLTDPRFIIGVASFVCGWLLCTSSDTILRRLRNPAQGRKKRYEIPTGGAFRWVSCPNYLGELIMWAGWATATWSLAGLAILAVTAANLVPRGLRNHQWCRDRLPGYPADRKALIPFLL
jgi:protein-S-isoprenylcysteine O-methyltransferase Ste14